MANMRLYNITAAQVPPSECTFLLGDNSEHGLPDPWAPTLRAVNLLGMETDGQEHYRVSRHYTIRLARFPEDEEVVRRILSEHVASEQKAAGEEVDQSGVDELLASYVAATVSQILLACRIWVDGGDDHCSVTDRLARAPEDVRHPNPVPKGASAVSFSGPKDYYVHMNDLPQPVLEEDVIGFVSVRPLEDWMRPVEVTNPSNGETGEKAATCEIERLFVEPWEEHFLHYILVETAIEVAKDNGYTTMRVTPVPALEGAKKTFEKAGIESSVSFLPAVKFVNKDCGGEEVEVWEINLDRWTVTNGMIAG